MARGSPNDVEKESLKRPALVFTDSDSLANTVKKDVGQSHDKRFNFAAVVADTHASRRPSDEDDGKGHSRLIFQQSCVSICGKKVYASGTGRAQKVFERCVVTKQVFNRCLRNLTCQILVFDCFL